MARNLIIKGHVSGVVNLLASDGTPCCHILVDGANGDDFAGAISPPGLVHDDDDPSSWANTPAKYKRADGAPLHVFAGVGIEPPPVIPVIVETEPIP